ncbi:hypothetical protein AAW12_22735 [Sphingobacterium sp. Ag1]|nr:hypothetical protein AAW12_22735 [Sphingobacterium sp. Ag1]
MFDRFEDDGFVISVVGNFKYQTLHYPYPLTICIQGKLCCILKGLRSEPFSMLSLTVWIETKATKT